MGDRGKVEVRYKAGKEGFVILNPDDVLPKDPQAYWNNSKYLVFKQNIFITFLSNFQMQYCHNHSDSIVYCWL